MLTSNLIKYALGALAIMFVATVLYFNVKVNVLVSDKALLESEVRTLQIELSNAERNTAMCKLSLESQTKDIEVLRVSYDSNVAELTEWKSRPPEIRYNTLYKTITKVDYKKGECNETKELINSISNLNYADL